MKNQKNTHKEEITRNESHQKNGEVCRLDRLRNLSQF